VIVWLCFSLDEILQDINSLEKDVHEAAKVVREIVGPEIEARARTVSARPLDQSRLCFHFARTFCWDTEGRPGRIADSSSVVRFEAIEHD
jgi:hypothetical protein